MLRIYKDQPLVEVRHHDAKATLRVRPIFLHNDDRIDALVSIVGLALVVFGLIESDLRNALGPDEYLEGLLPEGRAAAPPAATSSPPSKALDSPTAPTGSSSIASPAPNDASSNSSR